MEKGLLRILADGGQDVRQLPLAPILLVQGTVEGNIAIKGQMLIPACKFNGADDFTIDADAGKGMEGCLMAGLVMEDGAIQADHAFLEQIVPIAAGDIVGLCDGTDQILIAFAKALRSKRMAVLGQLGQRLIR